MYIALKWLFGMVLSMWIGLCLLDLYLKNSAFFQLTEFNKQTKNSTNLIHQNSIEGNVLQNKIYPVHNRNVFFQWFMSIAGACLVLAYYIKDNIIVLSKINFKTFNLEEIKNHLLQLQYLRNSANLASVVILEKIKTFYGICTKIKFYLLNVYKSLIIPRHNTHNVNLLLLKKLREYSEERRNVGQILCAAIQENKNIRMYYELESLAKQRLVKYIENSQKQIKENRSRYISCQQLYLVTHQENKFLKSRIKKLTQDKDDAERNLMKLVNYVWQSKNNELKAYCSRFIVQTKNNLLNSDARTEINQFINKSLKSKQRISEPVSSKLNSLDIINEVNENFHEEDLTVLVKDGPKLRVLPGECAWTIKDKDGFIEKLYEYETNFDNGDTIRRIRQYSVYYDKDCLLDISSSATLIRNTNIDLTSLRNQYKNKRITSSQAFRNFLDNNKIVILPTRSHTPSLTY